MSAAPHLRGSVRTRDSRGDGTCSCPFSIPGACGHGVLSKMARTKRFRMTSCPQCHWRSNETTQENADSYWLDGGVCSNCPKKRRPRAAQPSAEKSIHTSVPPPSLTPSKNRGVAAILQSPATSPNSLAIPATPSTTLKNKRLLNEDSEHDVETPELQQHICKVHYLQHTLADQNRRIQAMLSEIQAINEMSDPEEALSRLKDLRRHNDSLRGSYTATQTSSDRARTFVF